MKYIIHRQDIPLYKYIAECISKISDYKILIPDKNIYPINSYTKEYQIQKNLCLDKLTSKCEVFLLFPLLDFIEIYNYFKKYKVIYYFLEEIGYLPEGLLPSKVLYYTPSTFTENVLEPVVDNIKFLPFPVDTDKVNFTKRNTYNNNLLKALIREETLINHLFPEVYNFDYKIVEKENNSDIILYTGIRDYTNNNKFEYKQKLEIIEKGEILNLAEYENVSELRNHINITSYEIFHIIINEKDIESAVLFMKDNYYFYNVLGYKHYQIEPETLRKYIKINQMKYFKSITKTENIDEIRSVIIDYHSLESLKLS
jgi:hypothetical protein